MGEGNVWLDEIVEAAEKLQEASGIRPLWGTAQLFKHPRYMHGAATSKGVGASALCAGLVA